MLPLMNEINILKSLIVQKEPLQVKEIDENKYQIEYNNNSRTFTPDEAVSFLREIFNSLCFCYEREVEWTDVDGMQYAFAEFATTLLRNACSNLLASIGFPYKELDKDGKGLPLMATATNYLKGIRPYEKLKVYILFTKVTAFQNEPVCRIVNEDGETVITMKGRFVFIDTKTRDIAEKSDGMVEGLKKYYFKVSKKNKETQDYLFKSPF